MLDATTKIYESNFRILLKWIERMQQALHKQGFTSMYCEEIYSAIFSKSRGRPRENGNI